MYKKKSRSRALDVGLTRSTGFQEIDDNIEFSEGFTKESYEQLVFDTLQSLQKYNAALMRADHAKRLFEKQERELADANERVKAGIVSLYGRDSYEYTLLGGVRKSEIDGYRPETYFPVVTNGEEESGEPESDPGDE